MGKAPRSDPSPFSEERFAELGALEAQHNPESIFALQHLARQEAQKAFVYLDCSKRVQRAMTKNTSPFPRDFEVGDLVTFRRDNQRGGTKWSPTSRVIGHEGERNLWLLCGNVPVLVANQNVKVATPSEALAHSVLHGQPVIPDEVVIGGEQQSFLDARVSQESRSNSYEPSVLDSPEPGVEDEETELPFINWGDGNENLPPIPEDDELDTVGVTIPDISNDAEDMSDGADATDELVEAASSSQDRRRSSAATRADRNVRPRLETQPESERGSSLAFSRRESIDSAERPSAEAAQPEQPHATRPPAWPNPYDNLNDLPESLRSHF